MCNFRAVPHAGELHGRFDRLSFSPSGETCFPGFSMFRKVVGMSPEPTSSKTVVQEPQSAPADSPAKGTRRERRAFRRRPVRAKVRIQIDPLGMAPFVEVSPLN